MFKIRDALDVLEQRTLIALAEQRAVRGARSNDERRKVLARSYRGDAVTFLGDLTRDELLLVARELGLSERGARVASKSREDLAKYLLPSFDESSAPTDEKPAKALARPAPLTSELDAILPGWLVRLDTAPGSRDPLGLQTISGKHADNLLPGLTVFTSRARYYAFLCWAIATAQEGPVETHLERVHNLEKLLVLSEALRHGEHRNACSYIGARRGRAFVREAGGASLFSLPTKILKNQTSNGVLRLYRTSLVDTGLVEDDDLEAGLGLRLTDRGQRLAREYGEGLDEWTVQWALGATNTEQKRRETLERTAEDLCLSRGSRRRERTLLFEALFARSIESASPSALQRRRTAVALMREGILRTRDDRPEIAPEDADAIAEDGGVKAAEEEAKGNWKVVSSLLLTPPNAELHELQVAAAYQLLALALNQVLRSCLGAVTTAGRMGVDVLLAEVSAQEGAAARSAFGAATTEDVVARAKACFQELSWPQMASTGLDLLGAVLGCETTLRWVAHVAPEDDFVGRVIDRSHDLQTTTRSDLLAWLIKELVARHQQESVRKGKGEWLALEGDTLVRRDPRELLPIIHSLRFAQLEQLLSDLEVELEELVDAA